MNASATGSPATTGPKTPLRKVGDGGQESGSAPSTKKRKQYRSGYEVSTQALSYVPYALEMSGRKRAIPFGLPDGSPKKQPRISKKLSSEDLSRLARDASILPPGAELRDFQVQCTLRVLQRGRDICVIAPTGAGKSMLWCLPLLTSSSAVSLVVTPYTSLGSQGELDMNNYGLRSIFVHSEQNSDRDLERIAQGHYRVVFICVESLETPRFARVLHSPSFQAILQGVYIDEAHLVKESLDWRPGYQRLGQLRTVIGRGTPLVAISATLPQQYRDALCTHASLGSNYLLINQGNFRGELSLVILPLQHETSFKDLAFTLPDGIRQSDILPTLVYYDDIDKLRVMLWWFHDRLERLGLHNHLAGIVHAGLSDTHQRIALEDFRAGRTLILLATEKIGAGVHLPRVERVVQYRARHNLSLAKLDQRRGRGARTKGMTATCYFFVEPELISGDLDEMRATVDPGILALVRAEGCYQDVLDNWLENPLRRPLTQAQTTRRCCSHCQPDLASIKEFEFVMVDPSIQVQATSNVLPRDSRDAVSHELRRLRALAWKETWRAEWRSFGPKSLITDADIEAVAKVATSISSLDDLRPLTRIPYWDIFAPWLLSAVQQTVIKLKLAPREDQVQAEEQVAPVEGVGVNVVREPDTAEVGDPQAEKAVRRRSRRTNPRTGMHQNEFLLDFST
ncbi:P-loop containing nucleoside triphosphate hydrolase protein [Irpex lacteus]|nr:P-loop containing nucleoside triphosphate hydrolase protein [Irpex lacteus]